MDDRQYLDAQRLDAQTREGIDACRPHTDDLQSPELIAIAEKVESDSRASRYRQGIESCDVRMQSAIHDVPVPADLASRLVERLAATEIRGEANGATITLASSEASAVAPHARNRRTWISSVIAATVLVAIAGVLSFNMTARSPDDVATLAASWQDQLDKSWQPMASPPRKYPVPRGLTVRPTGWQQLSSTQGYHGVAYKLGVRDGRRAVLFVVRVSPGGQLPKSPPLTPQFSSGGKAVGAWLIDDRMFVLVVDGDERAYRSLLERPQSPLA